MLVVVFGGKEAGKSDVTRPSRWTPAVYFGDDDGDGLAWVRRGGGGHVREHVM
jgi:hypothetical protein